MKHGHFIWGAVPMLDTGHAWETFAWVSQPCPLKSKIKIVGHGNKRNRIPFHLSQSKESIHAQIVIVHLKMNKYSYSWFAFFFLFIFFFFFGFLKWLEISYSLLKPFPSPLIPSNSLYSNF